MGKNRIHVRRYKTWSNVSNNSCVFFFFFFFFTQSTFSRPFIINSFSLAYINKFNFRSVFFLTSRYIRSKIFKNSNRENRKGNVSRMPRNINPWGFSGSVIFIFFFSFLSLDFLSDYWLPFPFSRHISVFFVEWNSVQWEKKEKKLAKSDFDVSRKILCFWLVELDEITRNHGSPTSFGTVRIVQI